MGKQFNRQYRLLLGESAKTGLLLTSDDVCTDEGMTGLHVTFIIDKDTTKESNKSEIKVWNLSDASKELIQKKDLMVELDVGYSEDIGLVRIFIGSIISIHTKPDNGGLDEVTTIKCSDGQIAIRDSIMSLSFPPGTSNLFILKAIAQKMGLALDLANDVEGSNYENGYSFVGYGKDALDQVCGNLGATWSIQNAVLQVIMRNGVTRKKAVVFSAETGLIGTPERVVKSSKRTDNTAQGDKEDGLIDTTGRLTKEQKKRKKRKQKKAKKTSVAGWKIKTLLAPTVNPGDAIRIESGAISGWFKVESIKHSGGVYVDDWTSEIDIIEVMIDDEQRQ